MLPVLSPPGLAPDLELEADDGILASGLYYLSELVEEHTVFAKRFLTRLIYSIMVLQLLLCVVDGFPFLLTTLGIFSHVIYLGNMRRFPFVKLSDPLFVTSCGEFKSIARSLHLGLSLRWRAPSLISIRQSLSL